MLKYILLGLILSTSAAKSEEVQEKTNFLPLPGFTIGEKEKIEEKRNEFQLQLGPRKINFLGENFNAPEFILSLNHKFYPSSDKLNFSLGIDAHYHKFPKITRSYNLGILGQAKGTLDGLQGAGLTPQMKISYKLFSNFKMFVQGGYRVSYYEGQIDGSDNVDAIKQIIDKKYYKMVTRGFNTSVGFSYIFYNEVEMLLAVNSDFGEIDYPNIYLDENSGALQIQPSGWVPWKTTAFMIGVSSPF